jgi:hypothetical protein
MFVCRKNKVNKTVPLITAIIRQGIGDARLLLMVRFDPNLTAACESYLYKFG